MLKRFTLWLLHRFAYVRELEHRAKRAEFVLQSYGRELWNGTSPGTSEGLEQALAATLSRFVPVGVDWHLHRARSSRAGREHYVRFEIELRGQIQVVGGKAGKLG